MSKEITFAICQHDADGDDPVEVRQKLMQFLADEDFTVESAPAMKTSISGAVQMGAGDAVALRIRSAGKAIAEIADAIAQFFKRSLPSGKTSLVFKRVVKKPDGGSIKTEVKFDAQVNVDKNKSAKELTAELIKVMKEDSEQNED